MVDFRHMLPSRFRPLRKGFVSLQTLEIMSPGSDEEVEWSSTTQRVQSKESKARRLEQEKMDLNDPKGKKVRRLDLEASPSSLVIHSSTCLLHEITSSSGESSTSAVRQMALIMNPSLATIPATNCNPPLSDRRFDFDHDDIMKQLKDHVKRWKRKPEDEDMDVLKQLAESIKGLEGRKLVMDVMEARMTHAKNQKDVAVAQSLLKSKEKVLFKAQTFLQAKAKEYNDAQSCVRSKQRERIQAQNILSLRESELTESSTALLRGSVALLLLCSKQSLRADEGGDSGQEGPEKSCNQGEDIERKSMNELLGELAALNISTLEGTTLRSRYKAGLGREAHHTN